MVKRFSFIAGIAFTAAAITGGTLAIQITPGGRGENEIILDVQDADGQPLELKGDPVVQLTLPQEELGTQTFTAAATQTPGRYTGTIQVPLEGEWEITVTTHLSRFSQPISTVTVPFPHVGE